MIKPTEAPNIDWKKISHLKASQPSFVLQNLFLSIESKNYLKFVEEMRLTIEDENFQEYLDGLQNFLQ